MCPFFHCTFNSLDIFIVNLPDVLDIEMRDMTKYTWYTQNSMLLMRTASEGKGIFANISFILGIAPSQKKNSKIPSKWKHFYTGSLFFLDIKFLFVERIDIWNAISADVQFIHKYRQSTIDNICKKCWFETCCTIAWGTKSWMTWVKY